jgi:hypothetical protein
MLWGSGLTNFHLSQTQKTLWDFNDFYSWDFCVYQRLEPQTCHETIDLDTVGKQSEISVKSLSNTTPDTS